MANSRIVGAGRGVFARRLIKKGETIEQCPTIELPQYDAQSVNSSELVNYMYYLGKGKRRLVIALGYGSVYNHSEHPNAIYKDVFKNRTLDFIALQTIQKDEEITVRYNQGKQKDACPLWFTV